MDRDMRWTLLMFAVAGGSCAASDKREAMFTLHHQAGTPGAEDAIVMLDREVRRARLSRE